MVSALGQLERGHQQVQPSLVCSPKSPHTTHVKDGLTKWGLFSKHHKYKKEGDCICGQSGSCRSCINCDKINISRS